MAERTLTACGYEPFEVVSALQKSIRRGLEQDALYWARIMYDAGLSAWLWKRLRVISVEDVGLGDPQAVTLVDSCHRAFKDFGGKSEDRLMLVMAVLYLVRAKKSRCVDWSLIATWAEPVGSREIPDCAIDKHTKRGKALGRGFKHFIEEGGRLTNVASIPGEAVYKEKAVEFLMGKGEATEEDGAEDRFNELERKGTDSQPSFDFQ